MAQIIVLGAGMVGVSTALALQARGDQVLLVDRRGIGRETSYGNAGAIQTEAVEPYPFPRDPRSVLDVALKRVNDVNWHLSSLPEYARMLLTYWQYSAPARHRSVARFYCQLIEKSACFHAPLVEAAGVDNLIERNGYRALYRTAARFEAAQRDAERVLDTYGVGFHKESADQLAAAEPNLQTRLAGALHYNAVWTCRSPGGLTAAYGNLFVARGGQFAYGDAQSLASDGTGWTVQAEEGWHRAEHIVLALGPWSTQITDRLGYRIPMLRKRGYHRHYHVANGPRASVMDVERGTFVARMNQGLRLTTGVELTRRGAPINWMQIRRAELSTRDLFNLGAAVELEPWFGERPCMPDMLPVLGEAPNHPGLWFHFGHGHQGFTAGPASADVLVGLMDGNETPLTQALGPRRFN
ncbi:FAD-dependent oxidoreductase [Paracoccus liaowanqingii]|uniref:FAD-dependent oxidoreductase n=1 Tax=Paracoccus liaowanqingii TaxID=2560053 RepID=A0A4Z1CST7_9RHOB|nr:FAD-dependent oxidoreductase [Paracoccus liaowanqingii]TGN68332.1 FAD-dependent oxidoreductase [Paracoccus liaowanqingii]